MRAAWWLCAIVAGGAHAEEATVFQTLKKATPILVVEAIEPSLPFWVDALGFRKGVEVPRGEALGFVILEGYGLELMLQSRASIADEVASEGLPEAMSQTGPAVLYVEVEDLDAVRERLREFDVLVPHRRTFYGAEEMWVREPGGNMIGFAKPAAAAAH